MSKKMMVLALAVASAALFALPAAASAQSWHLNSTTTFSLTGAGGKLTSTDGLVVSCTSTTGSGSFSTTTEGTMSLILHGCTSLGFACTTPGQSSGTITFKVKFDGIMVSTNNPGMLLTPDSPSSSTETNGKKFITDFSCIGISTKVYGNGVIGTLHSPLPACGASASTWGLNFESSEKAGHQKDQVWTGTSYDLITSPSDATASLDDTATLHFPAARTLTCTHVA
jgi:hypothetical protein